MAEPDFWNDQEAAQKLIGETNVLKEKRDSFMALEKNLGDLETSLELLRLEPDPDLQTETEASLAQVQDQFHQYELNLLLSGEYDGHNAMMEIHPGAGGTEAMDWGNMLLRMYQRYCESHDLKFEVNNFEPGDEAGLKSASIRIVGKNAYGLLKSEHGVHRLVRISPFDSAKRRHTSFASVEVIPEVDDSVNIDIDPKDLRIDVYRSSGAGGQHINKTSSAVRMTHLPTGIVVAMQDQRSQQQNRAKAMEILKSRVYDFYESQNRDKYDEKRKSAVGTGDRSERIRTYNYPQNRVTDHRIGLTINKLDRVMDGDLDEIIDALTVYYQTKQLEELADNA